MGNGSWLCVCGCGRVVGVGGVGREGREPGVDGGEGFPSDLKFFSYLFLFYFFLARSLRDRAKQIG